MGVSSDKILSNWSKNFHSSPDANCRDEFSSCFLAGLPGNVNVSLGYLVFDAQHYRCFFYLVYVNFLCFSFARNT